MLLDGLLMALPDVDYEIRAIIDKKLVYIIYRLIRERTCSGALFCNSMWSVNWLISSAGNIFLAPA